jgi:hypothetical protein
MTESAPQVLSSNWQVPAYEKQLWQGKPGLLRRNSVINEGERIRNLGTDGGN